MGLFIISLIIGIVIGLIVVLVMKGQLHSVGQQYGADNYQDDSSLKLRINQDLFLYQKVTKQAKPKNDKK